MTNSHLYLVRHGEDLLDRESFQFHLSDAGIHQAEGARDALLEEGLGPDTVVLSSSEPRAIETAAVIAEGLGTTVETDEQIKEQGLHPTSDVIADLAGFITALEEDHSVPTEGVPVVLVTHERFLARVTNKERVRFGEVIDWQETELRNSEPVGVIPAAPERVGILGLFRRRRLSI